MEEQNIKKHVNVTIIDVTQRGTDTWSNSYKIFREFTGTEYQEVTYIFTKIENGTPYVIRDIDIDASSARDPPEYSIDSGYFRLRSMSN